MVDIGPAAVINAGSADLTTVDNLTTWALNSPDVGIVSLHLAPGTASGDYATASTIASKGMKAVLISNDGDPTQKGPQNYQNLSDRDKNLNEAVRLANTNTVLNNTFLPKSGNLMSFDFLDKGLNGTSWSTTSKDYQLDAKRIDKQVLSLLGKKANSLNSTTGTKKREFELPVETVEIDADLIQVTASNISATSLGVNWIGQSDDLAGFDVMLSTDGQNFAQVAEVDGNAASARIGGLRENTPYFVKVVAFNDTDRVESAIVSVSTAIGPPTAIDDALSTCEVDPKNWAP
jgi:Fibronectin type III domain